MPLYRDYIRVPYASTVHGEEEIEAVVNVLKTSTQMSKNVEIFEKKIAKIFDHNYGVMVNSGSSALYLLIESLNLKKKSEVITPALTFATTVGSLVKNGLIPRFVDVKPNTFCADISKIEEAINDKTSAICAPDLMGNICEWDEIRKLANKYDLKVIQDSADTLGSYLNGKPTGFYSDCSITSFYGSHVINGAGNGGMLLTSDKALRDKAKLLRSWGRSSSLFADSESIENRFNVFLDGINYDAKFVFEDIGYQLEPSEISAAFALIQLSKLSENVKKRKENFDAHISYFSKYDFFDLPITNPKADTSWLAFPMIIKENSPFTRKDLQIFLEERNIQTRVVFTGNILRQPGFKDINCIGQPEDFSEADRVMKGGILLALHHGLTQEMKDHFYESLDIFLSKYSV